MSDYDSQFRKMLLDGQVPVDQDSMEAVFRQEVAASGVTINNDSPFSPFWRAVKALVTVPALWLVNAMITSILPNLFVRTASDMFLDMLAWSLDVERKPATKATGNIQFLRIDTTGVQDIPTGTVIQTDPVNGAVYQLRTTQAVSMGVGVGSVLVPVEALKDGSGHNLSAGYFIHLLEPISGVSVTNLADWLVSAGADEENDDNLRWRCRNQFSALNQYHTDAVYIGLITSFAGIGVGNVFFDSNGPRGPGSANAYILLDAGEPSLQMLSDLATHIMTNGNHGHGDDMQFFAMPGVNYDLNVDIWYAATLGDAEKAALLIDVENCIRAAFRENTDYSVTTTQPHSTFSFSVLAKELHIQFPGLAAVEFDLPNFTNQLNVGRLNSLIVTAR